MPRADASSAAAPDPGDPVRPEPAAAPARVKLRVLLVEDDPLVRLSTAGLIEDLGHEAHEAGDAGSALAYLERVDGIDILLTDVGLPDLSGSDLAVRARRLRPGLDRKSTR